MGTSCGLWSRATQATSASGVREAAPRAESRCGSGDAAIRGCASTQVLSSTWGASWCVPAPTGSEMCSPQQDAPLRISSKSRTSPNIDSARGQMDARAPHTVVGRNRRCCKGLEPSRRLSETTGSRHLSAFRIAFRRQRQQNGRWRGAGEVGFHTLRTDGSTRPPPAPVLPQLSASQCARYRRPDDADASIGARRHCRGAAPFTPCRARSNP